MPLTHLVPAATGRITAPPAAQMPNLVPSAEQTRAPGAPQALPPVAGCAAGAAAGDGAAEEGAEGAAAGATPVLPPAGRETLGIPAPPAGEGLAAAPPPIPPMEPLEPEPEAAPAPEPAEPELEPDEAAEPVAQDPYNYQSQHCHWRYSQDIRKYLPLGVRGLWLFQP